MSQKRLLPNSSRAVHHLLRARHILIGHGALQAGVRGALGRCLRRGRNVRYSLRRRGHRRHRSWAAAVAAYLEQECGVDALNAALAI